MKPQLIATLLALALSLPSFAAAPRTPTGRNNTPRTPFTTPAIPNSINRSAQLPITNYQLQPLTNSYAILNDAFTSIFSRNRIPNSPFGGDPGPGTGTGPGPGSTSPVLRGIIIDPLTGPLASLELPNSANLYLHEGQTYNNFKVLRITLDSLQLSSPTSALLTIPLGYNLDGQPGSALPTAATFQPADALNPANNPPARTPNRNPAANPLTFGDPPMNRSTLISPLDPPLPPGTADAASRMAQRRLNQLNFPATLPTQR